MKRSIAVAAILSMCVSGLPAFAAGNTAPSLSPAMDKLVKAELIRGNGQGVNAAYLNKPATRIQAAVLYLRLSGLEKKHLPIKEAIRLRMLLRQARCCSPSLDT